MIMKKMFFDINKIMIGLLLVAASLASCKKLIEIPENPPAEITRQQQFSDSASTISAVAGVYTYNAGNGFAYSDGALTYCTGLSSDELTYSQTDDKQEFYSYTLTPLNMGVPNLWANPYQGIYQVNDILSGITNNSGLSASFVKQITGEMEVVRALYYFNLVNLFGDVPLVTTTNYGATEHIPKTPVATVYHQIMTDLADARTKLTAAYPVYLLGVSSERARPNLYVALTMLAKVNLYQGNWQNAYNEADSVINSGMYDLKDTPLNGVFLDGSAEAIWQIPEHTTYTGVADGQNFLPYYPGAAVIYPLTTSLVSAFEPGDQRFQNWVASSVTGTNTAYYPFKYKNRQPITPLEDQMIFRLAEVYLIRAEAAAHLSNLPQALADINIIRARAGLAAVSATSQADVLNAVMHERQIELFCEWGNRWYDLKRTGTAVTVLGTEKTGFSVNAELYPLPQTQIQLDNLLTQNPGY
jgi:starch-binding outer membrane protein, SusD/RagB family